ncbi:hypothetical protein [Paraburkholderia phosphatilytica]|uniref:hypothetical protein n=1 Tax=Paraburkholderia phosphatilytica TaxID=2282883 RepID=UPI000E5500DD|nr:hypothetical protein [Paraburkholderia phosphatilytica]
MKSRLFYCAPLLGVLFTAGAFAQPAASTLQPQPGCAYYRARLNTVPLPQRLMPNHMSSRVARSDEDLVIPAAAPDGWIVNACRRPAGGAL